MITRIEQQLGRTLELSQRFRVATLNDLTPDMVAELRRLSPECVNAYLRFHLRAGSEGAFEDFTRDVVRGGADAGTWGVRDVVAVSQDAERGEPLTLRADALRAALGALDGDVVRLSVSNAREVNRRGYEATWGALGVLVRGAPYTWARPGMMVLLGPPATDAVSEAGFVVSFRRWIASRVAWAVKSTGLALATATPAQVAAAAGVAIDQVSPDGAAALAALIREAALPFHPDQHVRGYVGPDAWFADAPLPSAPSESTASTASDEPIALPAGTVAGAVARRTASATLYVDPRIGLALALPPAVFISPGEYTDMACGIDRALLQVSYVPRVEGVRPTDKVTALVQDLTGQVPEPFELTGPGVAAAAVATLRSDDDIRAVAALAGEHAGGLAVVLLSFDYRTTELDTATALTLWSAILASATFGVPPGDVPPLVPESAWWAPGHPLQLRASRPPLAAVPGAGEAARDLLVLAALRPPTQRIGDAVRDEIAHRLAGVGLANAAAILATVATVHDVRGLAVALASATQRQSAQGPAQTG